MRLALLGGVLVLAAGHALACPIPELPLHLVTDDSFDRPATRAVLELVGRAASLDAVRARARSPELGRELAALPPIEPYVSAEAFRVAVRLRQLDCAVIRGAPANDKLFRSIANEALAVIRALDASQPIVLYVKDFGTSKPLVLPAGASLGARRSMIFLPPPLTREEHLRTAYQRRVGVGVLFGVSAIALGGAIAATVATVGAYRSCRAPDAPFFCDVGVELGIFGTVLLYSAALGTALPAGLLLWSAREHERSARAPTLSWSASSSGASVSLRFRF